MAKPKKGLGKGLDALFSDNHVEDRALSQLKISEIEPNRQQPRDHFDETALGELADSIRNHGVLQPLVVRPLGDGGGYQIVAGERRWRASRMAGLTEIPVVIRELSDLETLEIGIVENLQREDLNPVELALGYRSLMEDHNMTQEQVASKVGKSRPVVANTVRLLNLPDQVLDYIKSGDLTTGHARALLAIDEEEQLLAIAKKAIKEGLLVRDIENLARSIKKGEPQAKETEKRKTGSSRPNAGWGNSYYKEMELALSAELGRKVEIHEGEGKSTLLLEFYSKEELEDLVGRLTGEL